MRKVILNLAVSLDGFIEGPNGEFDWCIMDDDMDFGAFVASIDSIFFGRVSYEVWKNYQPNENSSELEKKLLNEISSKNKFVFSKQQGSDEGVSYISSDIEQLVADLKQQEGKDIWLYGGASLIKTFIDLQLIDVYQLSVHPVALGSGKPLFENLKNRLQLALIDYRTFRSGVIQLNYAPAK